MYRNTIFGFQKAGINISKIFLALLFFLQINLCYAQIFFTDLEDSVFSNQWINVKLIDSDEAYSGSHYAMADSVSPFGLGIESRFPETYQGKTVTMSMTAWIMSSKVHDQALFVITIQKNGENIFWKALNLKELFLEKDQWFKFSEQILVPASITKEGVLKAYLWNSDRQDTIGIDDLGFEFEHMENQSYFPEFNFHTSFSSASDEALLTKNTFYSLYYNKKLRRISMYSASGKLLISNIEFYADVVFGSTGKGSSNSFDLKSIKLSKSGTKIRFIIDQHGSHVKMDLICTEHSPQIQFELTEKYQNEQLVHRKSLIIQSGQPISKVYRSNRKLDTADFQKEYWLGNQGFQFGIGTDSWVVYHTPTVSSLQINTVKNQVLINLDYKKDHPFLHFPMMDDTMDVKEDISTSMFNKGDKHTSQFAINLGNEMQHLPRFLKNPSGFLATYIWTEHADFTDIKTNRATFFGSEEIIYAENAIGGFVKYNIPVTKSVFYFNPDQVTNAEISAGKFIGYESTILGDNSFADFLVQLNNSGNEICLHTPEQYSTTKKAMRHSLKAMSKSFSSPTWIDHGYNNGQKNNREDLVCDGALKQTDYYYIKKWKKAGINYFWNPYYEDYEVFDTLQFGELINKPYPGFGDHIPNPDFWQHTTRTADLWHWPTKSVIYVERDDLWDFLFNDAVLNDFIDNWSVEINHCYPAWVDPAKGFWEYDSDGMVVAQDGFNKTLARLAELRDQGLVNITTVKDFMDYQKAIIKTAYKINPDGSVEITNNEKRKINNMAFVTTATLVLVNENEPKHKIVDGGTFFWFDLEPGETKMIRTIN